MIFNIGVFSDEVIFNIGVFSDEVVFNIGVFSDCRQSNIGVLFKFVCIGTSEKICDIEFCLSR